MGSSTNEENCIIPFIIDSAKMTDITEGQRSNIINAPTDTCITLTRSPTHSFNLPRESSSSSRGFNLGDQDIWTQPENSGPNRECSQNNRDFTSRLNDTFALKYHGSLYYFLGIEVYRDSSGFHLSQAKYTMDILKKFGMLTCAPVATTMVIGRPFTTEDGEPMEDPSLYTKAVGSLQYLVTTRPDIAFSFNKLRFGLDSNTVKDVHFLAEKVKHCRARSLAGNGQGKSNGKLVSFVH
ncbi:putative RNA-directed DNA polymerase [Senna tora]|uniref:Putative RNA-directed DNA polymerase n=1 Tax=Senna tora TaxID=362788 RepID=A0A834XFJ8_9FABA|nr:putative RNA-directed DNA polymerase [Senna tora]